MLVGPSLIGQVHVVRFEFILERFMGDDARKAWYPRVRSIVEVPTNRIQALRLEGLQTFDNRIGELLPVQVGFDPLEQEQIVFCAQTLTGEESVGGKT